MKITIGFTFALLAGTALFAQQTPTPAAAAPMKAFAASADVTALIAKAKSIRKEGQAIVAQPLLQFAPYTATLEYRASAGAAAVHEKDAEMFYVIEGSATLVTGGKLAGGVIQGGETKTVSKGDFFVVPEGMPHWFSAVDGAVVLMTIKMPRGTAGQ